MESESAAIYGFVNLLLKKKLKPITTDLPWHLVDPYPAFHPYRELAEHAGFKFIPG
jgi:hypothetical protein